MARQFLGNIKGERGPQGPKGDGGEPGKDGGFNGESIGVNNLINITNLTPRGETATYDYDLKNGVVNYSDIEWYLSQKVVLNGVKHVFRLEDFLSNPNYASGRINLQLMDSDRVVVTSVFVTPKTNVVVDLTGRDRQEYEVQIRVTNTELFSGFIEKPMLVEGDVSVLWNHKDIVVDNAHRNILYGYTIDKEETEIKFVANNNDTIKFNDGFILDGGIYQINFNLRTQNTDSVIERNRYRIKFYIDDVLYLSRLSGFNQQNLDVSFSIPVDSGVLTITSEIFTKETADDSIPLFTGATDSQISIVKLGGF